jgi:uncharacterized protein YjiS (DUF1127 family)
MKAGGVMGALRAYGEYRRTIRVLAHLSDRELSDVGIARQDIRSAARFGTFAS